MKLKFSSLLLALIVLPHIGFAQNASPQAHIAHFDDVPLTIVIDSVGAKSAQAARDGQKIPTHVKNGSIFFQTASGKPPVVVS